MDFQSDLAPRSKAARAALLTLALGVLLARGAERFGLVGTEAEQPRTGERQLQRWAGILSTAPEAAPAANGQSIDETFTSWQAMTDDEARRIAALSTAARDAPTAAPS